MNAFFKNVNIKNIIRTISVIVVLLFFTPSFLVSCAGQNVEVSMKSITTGSSYMGEEAISSHLVLIVLLLIPAAIFVLWFMMKYINLKVIALASMMGGLVDFILWMIVKSNLTKEAGKNACTSSATGWFYLNQLLLIILFVIILGIYIGKIDAELKIFDIRANLSNLSNQKMSDLNIKSDKSSGKNGFCQNCGAVVYKENQFCVNCGARIEGDE